MNRRKFFSVIAGAVIAAPVVKVLGPSLLHDVHTMLRAAQTDVGYGPYRVVFPDGAMWMFSGWVTENQQLSFPFMEDDDEMFQL